MSFAVNLYSFSKRDNSTKRPSGSGDSFNCVMKHGCGILNPSISLDIGLTADPSHFNYAYIPSFGRYYFIEEWFFEDALWTASLKVDVLATYKTEIGSSDLYVLRASNDSNGAITDLLYPSRTGCNFQSSTKTNPWTDKMYVVGVVNADGGFGSLAYYLTNPISLRRLCYDMMDPAIINPDNGFNFDDASQALQLSLVNPIQYVKSCIMIPVGTDDFINLGGNEQMLCYNFLSSGSGYRINSATRIYKDYSFNIIKHPDTNSRGNYVNSAPFTSLSLTVPPFGCIDIDTSVTCNASTIQVDIEVDPISGKGVLIVACNGIVLNRIEAQIGVPISLSSVTRDYIGAATSAAGAIGAMAGGGFSGFAGAAVGVGNAVEAMQPRASTIGTTGSFVSNRGTFRLDHQFFRPIADDNAHNGRPLCAVRNLGNLGGYMLIQDGDVSINGTSTEDNAIRNYLETGFYYE